MRILIIDNDSARREVIDKSAKARGHETHAADTTASAIERLQTPGYDAVFASNLGGSWGICSQIRSAPGGNSALVIALTELDDAETALTEGADDYLLLPATEPTISLQLFVAEERARKKLSPKFDAGHENALWNAIQGQDQIGILLLTNDGRVVSCNDFGANLLTGERGDLAGKPFRDFLGEQAADSQKSLNAFLAGKSAGYRAEVECAHSTTSRWAKLTANRTSNADDGAPFAVVVMEDVSEQRRLEETLERHNFYDPLTGLPNRGLFIDRLAHVMKRNMRQPHNTFGLLFVDVDRFKNLNDSVGREQGDQLLIDLSKRLVKSIRPGDTVARLGGDEFSILLENIHSVADATRVSERIREELIEPTIIDGQEVIMSVSIGIATSESGYEDPEEVMRDADTAMHRAKTLGKGRHHIFDREMHDRVTNMLSLEQDLRRALERNEFWVAYQPIIDLKSGKIYGVEALLRWNHPERGFISPGDFIPLAEECGVILSLGQWVLGESCRQTQDWHAQFSKAAPLHLSVNVSSKQFADPKLVKKVEGLLNDSKLDPKALSLEITESVVMEKSDSATDALANLQNLGIRLHMDDFGTGYSSLAYLHRFPMDALKIDRSFIMRMDQGDRTIELVRTIINLARTQRLSVVAEGVETQKHLDTLRALGCDYAQGYFFSKPLNSEAITELLASAPQW